MSRTRHGLLWLALFVALVTARPVSAGATPRCGERPVPGVGRVISGAVASAGRLPSRPTALWFAAGSLGALAAHPFDDSTSRRLAGSASSHDVLAPGGVIGSAAVQIGAGLATYAIGRAWDQRCAGAVGADLLRAHAVAEALTFVFKAAVRRTRPDGGEFSLPSGHASVSFATATVLQRQCGWKAGAPAFAMASYVALSRVQARRHYLSDVVFGAAIGIISGHAATPSVRGSATVSVVPAVSLTQAAVKVVWRR